MIICVEVQAQTIYSNCITTFPSFFCEGHKCEAEGYQKILGVMDMGRNKLEWFKF